MSSILTTLRMREPWPAAAAALITLALQACGGSGSSAPPAPPPTVTLSVSPTSITAGQSAMLTWSSTQAASCTASGAWSGSEAPTGSQAVTPATSGSVTYTLTCTGAATGGGAYGGGGGGLTGSQTTTLSVNPATVFYGGEGSRRRWGRSRSDPGRKSGQCVGARLRRQRSGLDFQQRNQHRVAVRRKWHERETARGAAGEHHQRRTVPANRNRIVRPHEIPQRLRGHSRRRVRPIVIHFFRSRWADRRLESDDRRSLCVFR